MLSYVTVLALSLKVYYCSIFTLLVMMWNDKTSA